jgi:hypothetical protein
MSEPVEDMAVGPDSGDGPTPQRVVQPGDAHVAGGSAWHGPAYEAVRARGLSLGDVVRT